MPLHVGLRDGCAHDPEIVLRLSSPCFSRPPHRIVLRRLCLHRVTRERGFPLASEALGLRNMGGVHLAGSSVGTVDDGLPIQTYAQAVATTDQSTGARIVPVADSQSWSRATRCSSATMGRLGRRPIPSSGKSMPGISFSLSRRRNTAM